MSHNLCLTIYATYLQTLQVDFNVDVLQTFPGLFHVQRLPEEEIIQDGGIKARGTNKLKLQSLLSVWKHINYTIYALMSLFCLGNDDFYRHFPKNANFRPEIKLKISLFFVQTSKN